MSKAKVIAPSVVEQGLSKAEAARRFDVSWRWVHILATQYQSGGLDGLEPRSRRPHTTSRQLPEPARTRIVELREKLIADGLDAWSATIAWHLAAEGLYPLPAVSTIRQIITTAGWALPEPRKRPVRRLLLTA